MLPYISWPEFGLSEHSCMNNWEVYNKLYINWECCVLSLCSMNIAKNHWVTFKCTVIDISLHLLVPVTFWLWGHILQHFWTTKLYRKLLKTTGNSIYLGWTIPKEGQISPFLLTRPLTFKASTGHHWQSWPKSPIQLRSRCFWKPSHKTPGRLDHLKRPKLPIYYTPTRGSSENWQSLTKTLR